MSSFADPKRAPGWRLRGALLAATLSLASLTLAVACGGGDAAPPPTPTETFAIATFTPIPPNYTPEVVITRAAQQTAAAQTATARPPETPTVQGTPNTDLAACRTGEAGELRPPDLVMSAGSGDECGVIASWNWYDPVTDRGATIQPGQGSPMPDGALATTSGETLTFVPTTGPWAIESVAFNIYTFEENAAIPRDKDAQPVPGLSVVFVPKTEPVWSTTVTANQPTINPDLPAGHYIIAVRIDWAGSPEVEQRFKPLFTAYTFTIEVP